MKRKPVVSFATVIAMLLVGLPQAAAAAAPSNDDISTATAIPALPFTSNIDTTDATRSTDDPLFPCAYGIKSDHTVWYSFVASSTVLANANTTGSNFDTTLAVFTGSSGNLAYAACNDDFNGTLQSSVDLTVYAGNTYYFMVGSYPGATGGSLSFSISQPPGPANDDFNNATAVTSLPYTDTGNIGTATSASDDPTTCASSGFSVWYRFTAPADMMLQADLLNGPFQPYISVYTGARGSLSMIACSNYPPLVRFSASAGQTYYLMISTWPYNYVYGDYTLTVAQVNFVVPPNDDFNNAIAATSLPFTDSRDVVGATTASDDPYGCGGNQNTVWYAFTPSADMKLEVDLTGSDTSNYYPAVAVYTGSRGSLSFLTCGYFYYPARFDVTAGQTYYFMVGNGFTIYQGSANLVFTLRQAPPPLAVHLTVDATGSVVPRTGVATLYGSVTCNRPTWVDIQGSLTQKIGHTSVTGWPYSSVFCNATGTPDRWTAQVYSTPGQHIGGGRNAALFTAGKANSGMSAMAFDPEYGQWVGEGVNSSVNLRAGR